VLYSPRVRRTFADIITGRWRGHPIDLNHSHEDWARRESSDRHIRHVLTTFRSATFRRLLYPDLAVTTSISASVVLHNLLVAWEHEHTMTVESIERHGFDLLLHHEMITLPVEPFTMLSVALGLVLSVRTNRAYERFIEARVLLGSMTNVCRDLASRFMAREGGDAEAEQARRHAVCLVAAFAHTMKFHLTVDGLAFNDTRQKSGSSETLSKEALASEYRTALEQEILVAFAGAFDGAEGREAEAEAARDYIEALLAKDVGNRPLHVIDELCKLLAMAAEDSSRNLPV